MKWRERLALATALMSAVALWLPWVDHKAAALVLTGLDLPEFVRFMGEYRSGALHVRPLAFAAPVVVAALTGAAYSARSGLSFWGRVVSVAACLWLLTVPFPPLEKPGLLVAAGAAVLAVHGALTLVRMRRAAVAAITCVATLVAVTLALWQFAVMVPALNVLYGRPVAYGAGVWLEAAAAVLSLGLGVALARDALGRPPSGLR